MLRIGTTEFNSGGGSGCLKIPLCEGSKVTSRLLGVAALPLSMIAAFLFEISQRTPVLRSQLLVLAALSVGAACVCLYRCYMGLSKYLIIDETGLKIVPLLEGHRYDWSDIKGWEFVDDESPFPVVNYLRIWTKNDERPVVITYDDLPATLKNAISNKLRLYAPYSEMR